MAHNLVSLQTMLKVPATTFTPATYTSSGKSLPQTVDLSKPEQTIWNQLSWGSCTAFASLFVYVEWLCRCFGFQFTEMSEDAQYELERILLGVPLGQDSGAWGIDAVIALLQHGGMLEQVDPYNQQDFAKPLDMTKFANPVPAECFRQINKSNLLKDTLDALANGLPVLFGFTVYSGLESQQCAQTGILPMPSAGEQPIGGHEIVAVGFDQSKQMLRIRNSWGADWGDKGYFWMPYAYYEQYADDSAYVILPPTTPYTLKPFPTANPTPTPKPQPKPAPVSKYKLIVGPVDAEQMSQIDQLCIKLRVPVLKKPD